MAFFLQFRKATQQKKTKTKLETCARDCAEDCAELQARRVQATHGNRGRKRAAPISPRWVKRSQSDREMDRSVDERTTFKRPGESFKVRGPVISKEDKNHL